MSFELEFEGFSEKEMQQLTDDMISVTQLAMKYTAQEVWGNVRKEAPTDHGRLAGSFDRLEQLGSFEYKTSTNVHYALYVHEGTGIYGPNGQPIEIYPTNKQALYWPGAPHPVKKVTIQGQRPNPFATRAIENAEQRVSEFVRRAMREILGEI